MTLDDFRTYCLSKPHTSERMPFGDGVLVFFVGSDEKSKMFALASLDESPMTVNLKCEPARALELREEYDAITPGYHMNKQHWNTVRTQSGVPSNLMREMIDMSYSLVALSLPKTVRTELGIR
ncbi:MAG: MmcQ/YjbR family DNA-binding protein [Candidatus Kapabacteria bacterium]|nr:MmcQ/YjbR family DNA-binding protein [Candidatus Kapabacteria bacterium]